MVLCEHFIFTSADLEEKSGYQIVSKSSKVTSELLAELEDYMYPVGMDPNKFTGSKSMLVLKNKLVFVRAKNIGTGYDGRSGTIYSHVIILDVDDFKEFDNDSRIFNDLFVQKQTQEHLTPLPIDIKTFESDFSCIDVLGIALVGDFIRAAFSKKKIAVLSIGDDSLLQSLISLLPPSFRKISFSTLVLEPHRQSKFDLVQTQTNKSSLEDYFIIDPRERKLISSSNDNLFEYLISYFVDVVDSKMADELQKIHDTFESIPLQNHKEKLTLAMVIIILDSKFSYVLNQKMLEHLLLILEKTPLPFLSKYIKKLSLIFPDDMTAEHATRLKIIQILSDYIESKLTRQSISNMFNQLDINSNSRQSLLYQLVKKRENDFIVDGHKILLDFVDDYYNTDVIECFIENDILHQCIFDALENTASEHNIQCRLFGMLVKTSLSHNVDLLEKLFALKIFDFDNYSDVWIYRDVIEDLFKRAEFHKNLNAQIIFGVIKQIYTNVESVLPKDKKSVISNNLVQDVLYVLLNTTNDLLTRGYEVNTMKSEITEFKTTLMHFIEINKSQEQFFV